MNVLNIAFRVVLILSLAVIARIYLTQARSLLRDRLVTLGLWVALTASVVYPPLTTWLADRFGISRGVDLAIYIAFLVLFFMTGRLNAHDREHNVVVTQLVRELAIMRARPPAHSDVPE